MKVDSQMMSTIWKKFAGDAWQKEVNVREFIQNNYTPYEGGSAFLDGPIEATIRFWSSVIEGIKQGKPYTPVDFDTSLTSTITSLFVCRAL